MPLALIPAALGFLGKNWKLLALLGLLVAVGAYVVGNHVEIQHLKGQLATEAAANATLAAANASEHKTVQQLFGQLADNQKVCTAAESAAQANLTIAQHEARAAQARAVAYGSILHAIQSAPADPSPVSPVVRDAVDSLWNDPQAGSH